MTDSNDTIARRLTAQRERLIAAARVAGRNPEDVTLIAVSKKQSVEKIREAYAAGQRDFGENYVQELVTKAEDLRDLGDIRWHLIGHLQTNKARFVAGLVDRIHSVSSVKLARELGQKVGRHKRTVAASPDGTRSHEGRTHGDVPNSLLPLGVLVEVNVSGEESKSGCAPSDLSEVLRAIDEEPHLVATGLMTVPPETPDAEGAREYFEALVRLRDKNGGVARLPELSMGMSHDAEVAVASGATFVRIGTAIFGPRETGAAEAPTGA